MEMERWFNKIKDTFFKEKRKHWYEVRFVYNNKQGHRQFDFINQVGLAKQKTTLDKRILKKIIEPLHKHSKIKKLLLNGKLDIEILCYLGHFHKK